MEIEVQATLKSETKNEYTHMERIQWQIIDIQTCKTPTKEKTNQTEFNSYDKPTTEVKKIIRGTGSTKQGEGEKRLHVTTSSKNNSNHNNHTTTSKRSNNRNHHLSLFNGTNNKIKTNQIHRNSGITYTTNISMDTTITKQPTWYFSCWRLYIRSPATSH